MRKLRFITSRFDAEQSVKLNDGRSIEFMSEDKEHFIGYTTPFSLETGDIQDIPDGQKKFVIPNAGFVTVNHLTRIGQARIEYAYDTMSVDMGWISSLSQRQVNKIRETFRLKGYNVTEKAIFHNLDGYRAGEESGYRDEENGYHLFTDKRTFSLQFRLTTLSIHCDRWQKTYWM